MYRIYLTPKDSGGNIILNANIDEVKLYKSGTTVEFLPVVDAVTVWRRIVSSDNDPSYRDNTLLLEFIDTVNETLDFRIHKDTDPAGTYNLFKAITVTGKNHSNYILGSATSGYVAVVDVTDSVLKQSNIPLASISLEGHGHTAYYTKSEINAFLANKINTVPTGTPKNKVPMFDEDGNLVNTGVFFEDLVTMSEVETLLNAQFASDNDLVVGLDSKMNVMTVGNEDEMLVLTYRDSLNQNGEVIQVGEAKSSGILKDDIVKIGQLVNLNNIISNSDFKMLPAVGTVATVGNVLALDGNHLLTKNGTDYSVGYFTSNTTGEVFNSTVDKFRITLTATNYFGVAWDDTIGSNDGRKHSLYIELESNASSDITVTLAGCAVGAVTVFTLASGTNSLLIENIAMTGGLVDVSIKMTSATSQTIIPKWLSLFEYSLTNDSLYKQINFEEQMLRFGVSSDALVNNLNAEFLNGYEDTDFWKKDDDINLKHIYFEKITDSLPLPADVSLVSVKLKDAGGTDTPSEFHFNGSIFITQRQDSDINNADIETYVSRLDFYIDYNILKEMLSIDVGDESELSISPLMIKYGSNVDAVNFDAIELTVKMVTDASYTGVSGTFATICFSHNATYTLRRFVFRIMLHIQI